MTSSGSETGPESKPRLWASGDVYESYVGRWSRTVAREFLDWLEIPADSRWIDVGCGTGSLSSNILDRLSPRDVLGIDQSAAFIAHVREHIRDPRARFEEGDAQALPVEDGQFDVAVSGLVLNFVPEPNRALAEMTRAVRHGGTVAIYVWDYSGRMEMMRRFWDAAISLDPSVLERDESRRFSMCQPDPLEKLFLDAGLTGVTVRSIDTPTVFRDFDDYWLPFLGGQAPAPAYARSLDEAHLIELRERLRSELPTESDGSIHLVARAWAVRGIR
jgi:SAM-dependent methyltransferase